MAVVIDKIFIPTGKVKSYIRIKDITISTVPSNIQLGVVIEYYTSKLQRELAIMQEAVLPTVTRDEAEKVELPVDWEINNELLIRSGFTLEDYKKFFSVCNYTQDDVLQLYNYGIMPITVSPINTITFYLYKSEHSDFPTTLDMNAIKTWVYSLLGPDKYLRIVTDTPGYSFADSYQDDMETKEDIIQRYLEFLPFLKGKIDV